MTTNDHTNDDEQTTVSGMTRRRYVATAATLGAVGLAGCGDSESGDSAGGQNVGGGDDEAGSDGGGGDPPADDTATATDEPDAPDVTILDHELVESAVGNAEVAGTVQNTSGEEQSYIQVDAKFYNADGTRIGDSMWNANDVAVDERLEFQTVMSTTDYGDVAEYEIETGTSPF